MKRFLFSLIAFLLAIPALLAAGEVQFETVLSAKQLAPGGEILLAGKLTHKGHWHTQSHFATEGYEKTYWTLKAPEGIEISSVVYPQGEEISLFGDQLRVYSGEVFFGARVRVGAKLQPGQYKIESELHYQACDDRRCLAVAKIVTSIPIEVNLQPDTVIQRPEIFVKFESLWRQASFSSQPGSKGDLDREIQEKGLFLTLLGIFLLGLSLNLTPCVYPVIAVTLGFFSRQSSGNRWLLPLLYGFGIALTFTTLGVLTALSGGLFGALLQSNWIQIGLALLIFALALSCFGLFEIQAPSWLLNRFGGGKAGGAGALVMGLVMGITAAPCVGPLILSLLFYVAQQAEWKIGLLWFGTLSLGLALPYPVLGFFSNSMKSLPKAGDWTEWVKKLMGVLLIAVSAFFLSSVFFPHSLLTVLAAITLIGGFYLTVIEKTGRQGNSMWFARGALAVIALWTANNLYSQQKAEPIVWTNFEESLLETAKKEGKPALIDFTASWCNPCRGLESFTFRDPAVVKEAERFVRLQVDLTHADDPNVETILKRFEVVGPPTILFFDSSGQEKRELRIVEYVDAPEFLEQLKAVR